MKAIAVLFAVYLTVSAFLLAGALVLFAVAVERGGLWAVGVPGALLLMLLFAHLSRWMLDAVTDAPRDGGADD